MVNLETLTEQLMPFAEVNPDLGYYAINTLLICAPYFIVGIALYGGKMLGEYLEHSRYKKNPSLRDRPKFKF